MTTEFEARVEAVRGRVAAACRRAGARRRRCRGRGLQELRPGGRGAGRGQRLTVLGESKVQEAAQKIPLCSAAIEWHMVGHLQRNKWAGGESLQEDSLRGFLALAGDDQCGLPGRGPRAASAARDQRVGGAQQVRFAARGSPGPARGQRTADERERDRADDDPAFSRRSRKRPGRSSGGCGKGGMHGGGARA